MILRVFGIRAARKTVSAEIQYLQQMRPLNRIAREAEKRMREKSPEGPTGNWKRGIRRFRKNYPARGRKPHLVRIGVTNRAVDSRGRRYPFINEFNPLSPYYRWAENATAGLAERARADLARGIGRAR